MFLNGKAILITGAAGGIGRAVAQAFHDKGAGVALVDLSHDAVEAVAGEIGGERVLPIAADVTDAAGMEEVVRAVIEKFGRLDVVFANAGITCDPPSTISRMDEATFEKIVEVNLLGIYRTVKPCLPHILANRGHVLVTSSIYAFINGAINAPYAVSKAGVEMFGRSLRCELAGTGATAGVLYPGWVNTGIARSVFGGNPIATELHEMAFPGPMGKSVPTATIAKRVVRGVEKRRARITVPRLWMAFSFLRGAYSLLTDTLLDHLKMYQERIQKL